MGVDSFGIDLNAYAQSSVFNVSNSSGEAKHNPTVFTVPVITVYLLLQSNNSQR